MPEYNGGGLGWNAVLNCWGGEKKISIRLTSLLLYLSKAPHGGLFCMVRLAWVSRCRSDPLVTNMVEVRGLKGFSGVVAPELLAHTSMKLLRKCLQERRRICFIIVYHRLTIWCCDADYVVPQQVGPLGLLPWCYDSHLPEFETVDSAPQLQIYPQQTDRCNLALHCPWEQWSQTDTSTVLKQSCPSPTVEKITDVFWSPKNHKTVWECWWTSPAAVNNGMWQ